MSIAYPFSNQSDQRIKADAPINIGNKVWIGCSTTILKGTTIADGCIVGSNSFVNKVFNHTNCLIAGNPARIVKENVHWR